MFKQRTFVVSTGRLKQSRSSACVVVLALIGICLPAQFAPAAPPGPRQNCEPGQVICGVNGPRAPVSGVVVDRRHRPIGHATIGGGNSQPNGSGSSEVYTDVDGKYTTWVRTESAVVLSSFKPGYDYQYAIVDLTSGSAAISEDFSLPYSLSVSVSTMAFNTTPRTLTFESDTTAPLSEVDYFGATRSSQVDLRLTNGTTIPMSVTSTAGDPPGITRWIASWTVPSGTADGNYNVTSCVYDPAISTGCEDDPSTLLSLTHGTSYVIDAVGPSVSAVSPLPNHNTLNTQPAISFNATDSLSGINLSSATIQLDGTTVATGVTSFTSSSALGLGVHSVTATVSDLAGNQASTSWDFSVITLAASSASGSIDPKTVPVNPNGSVVPPNTVTFSGVNSVLSATELNLSSSDKWYGYGSFSRNVSYSHLIATFQNEAGLTTTVTAPITSLTYSSKLGLLAPSPESMGAVIPARSSTLADISVAVPVGFGTAGSSATISSVSEVAGGLTTPTDDPFPTPFTPGSYTLDGGVQPGADPAVAARITNSSGAAVVTVISSSPSLYYPCDGTAQPLCDIRTFFSRIRPQALFSVQSGGRCTEGCSPLLAQEDSTYGTPLIWSIGSPTEPKFEVWQDLFLYGSPNSASPMQQILWQDTYAWRNSSAPCTPVTRVDDVQNRTSSYQPGSSLYASALTVTPARSQLSETVHLVDPAGLWDAQQTIDVTGNYGPLSDLLPGAVAGIGNDHPQIDAAHNGSARIATGSSYSGSATYSLVAELRFDATFSPC